MNSIKTIIVDDEPLARKGLAVRLKSFSEIDIIQLCKNGDEAIEACQSQQVDLIFLDIQMPGKNGFEVVKALVEFSVNNCNLFASNSEFWKRCPYSLTSVLKPAPGTPGMLSELSPTIAFANAKLLGCMPNLLITNFSSTKDLSVGE